MSGRTGSWIVLVVVFAAGSAGLATAGHHLGFEALVLLALLGGLALAFGVFDGRPPRRVSPPPADPDLAASTVDALASLDGVEHRRFELQVGGPTLVVGPTGVVVVTTGTALGGGHDDRVDPHRWAHLSEVVAQVREAAAGGERPVTVRGVAVVPTGATVAAPDDGMAVVPVDRLADVVAEGQLLPMSSVGCLFERLMGQLAPDAALHV